MLRDGSMAWEVKDFLVEQERCLDVTVEGQVFPGKAAEKDDAKYKQPNQVKKEGTKKSKKKTQSRKPDVEGNRASNLKTELWRRKEENKRCARDCRGFKVNKLLLVRSCWARGPARHFSTRHFHWHCHLLNTTQINTDLSKIYEKKCNGKTHVGFGHFSPPCSCHWGNMATCSNL